MTSPEPHAPNIASTEPFRFEPIVRLSPELRTGAALRLIYRELLNRQEANRAGVRDGLEGEFLHDFRVAVRRTRTALRQMKRAHPEKFGERFAAEFRWLARTAGPARDLEVFVGALAELCAKLEISTGSAAALEAFLRSHQGLRRQQLREALESSRYAVMMRDWARFLESPSTKNAGDAASDAQRAVGEVAAERIDAAFRRVVARGAEVHEDASAELFHRLRLDCKKLRYLLEFFGSLFAYDDASRVALTLRESQDSLGIINDLRVHAEWVDRARRDGVAMPPQLAEKLRARQRTERRLFMPHLAAFASNENETAIRNLLTSRSG
jgi:CHAD domain-containing protein